MTTEQISGQVSGQPVIEHVVLSITPGREEEFEGAYATAKDFLAQSPGFRWVRLVRQVESPSTYLLLVGWDSYDAHMVVFRESDLFGKWRGVVGEFFSGPPELTHYAGELPA